MGGGMAIPVADSLYLHPVLRIGKDVVADAREFFVITHNVFVIVALP